MCISARKGYSFYIEVYTISVLQYLIVYFAINVTKSFYENYLLYE